MRRGFVGGLVIGVYAELSEGFSVVGRDERRRLAEDAQVRQLGTQGSYRVVGEPDPDVVAVEHPLHICI